MNIDTDTQYAFTRPVAGHMFTNYDGVLKVDGEVGNKKAYDPRAWGKAAEAGMAARVVEACQRPALGRQEDRLMRRRTCSAARHAAAGRRLGRATPWPRARPPTRSRRSTRRVSLPWAVLAEQALAEGRPVEAYAYARTGYHRGLDALRRSGWRGQGPIPWEHEPNRGFLRALRGAGRGPPARSASADEEQRCATFLADSDPQAARELGLAN